MGTEEEVYGLLILSVLWYGLVTLALFAAALVYNWWINNSNEEVGREFVHQSLLVVGGVLGTEIMRAVRLVPIVWLISAQAFKTYSGISVLVFLGAYALDVILAYGVTGAPMIAGNLSRAKRRTIRSKRKMEDQMRNG